jgi:putative hydrolase of the HAD superfamily
VISIAWPSLNATYRLLGLRHFFDAFVISAKLGYLKPDRRTYQQAIDEIGLPASQLAFVDDWPDYVRAANALGLLGVVIVRGEQAPPDDLPWITNLVEFESL